MSEADGQQNLEHCRLAVAGSLGQSQRQRQRQPPRLPMTRLVACEVPTDRFERRIIWTFPQRQAKYTAYAGSQSRPAAGAIPVGYGSAPHVAGA